MSRRSLLTISPTFAAYLAARLLSIAGAAATTIVVPILVFQTTGSAALTGLIAAIGGATYLLLGIPVGYLADRWHRGTILVTCTILRAIVLLTIPLAGLFGSMSIGLLVGVLILTNALFVVTDAAQAGALRTLVGIDRLPAANSMVSGSAGLVEVIAPVAAGAALAVVSPEALFAAEAFLLLTAAILIWMIRPSLESREATERQVQLGWRNILGGLSFVIGDAPSRVATIAALAFAVAEGIVLGQLVVLITHRNGEAATPVILGASYAAIAIGSVIGAILAGWIPLTPRPGRNAGIALVLSAALLAGFVVAPTHLISTVLIGTWAIPFMCTFVSAVSIRQMRAPEGLQGRTAVAGRLLTLGVGVPVGSAAGGLITQMSTIDVAYITASVLSAVVGLLLFMASRSRAGELHGQATVG